MHEAGVTNRAWWKAHGRKFALAAGITTTVVVALGWLTDLRGVLHGALLSFAIAALLPFVIIAAGVAVILLVALVGAIAAALGDGGGDMSVAVEGGAGLIEGGARIAPKYYAFLARRRHPVFWGTGAGVFLGGLLLWAVLAIFVMPGETRTTDTLYEARARIELYYAEHGGLPKPDADHRLVLTALLRCHSEVSAARNGSDTTKRAPPVRGRSVAIRSSPPCSIAIFRAIASPSPVPVAFVVT